MKDRGGTGRVQDKMIDRLERQEKQEALKRDRFFKFKLSQIHNRLSQALLMERIVETDNPRSVSESLLTGLKKALNSSEFDFKYFVAPIRDLVPRANPYSLYITQYIKEILINEPSVIDIYGTDEEIYQVVDRVINQINTQFEEAEKEITAQLAHNRSLIPGSAEYQVALEELFRKRVGESQE